MSEIVVDVRQEAIVLEENAAESLILGKEAE